MKRIYQISTFVVALGVTGALYQNCSNGLDHSSDAKSATELASSSSNGTLVRTTFSENLLENMVSLTGIKMGAVTANDRAVLNYYNGTNYVQGNGNVTAAGARARINENGAATGINAPMWMSVTTLAGEVCNILVTQERALAAADRKFFNGIDFARGASGQMSGVDQAVHKMARAFWARSETIQEKAVISSTLNTDFGSLTAAASSAQVALAACTVVLASLDSQKL